MSEVSLEQLARKSTILPRRFYERDATTVAKDLLGKVLVHGATAGMIVEVEAYLGTDDLAAHSAAGLTPRTRVIFGPPGHAYVYFIYGMYNCLNFVAEPAGTPGCVLIRAVQPLAGLEEMYRRRPAARQPEQLGSGPGKLVLALGIHREHNGADLTRGPLTVHRYAAAPAFDVVTTPRIGITKCADWPLRFYIKNSPYVSKGKFSK